MTDERQVFTVGSLLRGDGQLAHRQEIYLHRGVVEHIISASDTSQRCRQIRETFSAAQKIDMSSGVMLPGLINSHHHAYSFLARGIPVRGELRPFQKTLENLWWRLDRCLDQEAVHLSGLLTGISCLRHGCTTIVDHHSSPNYVRGSLDTLADAFTSLSMTSVLCAEISDRNGSTVFHETVEENLSFLERKRDKKGTRGLFGLHASFTLSSNSLKEIAAVLPDGVPLHIHVAEDMVDVTHARSRKFEGPLQRLHQYGVLNRKSLIVHGIHLSEEETSLLESLDLRLAHNPQSNFNNSVGYPNIDHIPANRLLLGTDGMSSNMLGAAYFAYLAYLGNGQGKRDPSAFVQKMFLLNPATYLSELFGRPVGRIEEGHPADFAIFDYDSPTPLTAENIMMHILFGLVDRPLATWVYARGNLVVSNGELQIKTNVHPEDAARKKAQQIWESYLKQ